MVYSSGFLCYCSDVLVSVATNTLVRAREAFGAAGVGWGVYGIDHAVRGFLG